MFLKARAGVNVDSEEVGPSYLGALVNCSVP